MTATPFHGSLDPNTQSIHVPFQFSFPDAASRTGAPASRLLGGASKLAYQQDTSSLWLLTSVSPTPVWSQVAGSNTQSHRNFTLLRDGTWDNRIVPLWQGLSAASANIRQVAAYASSNGGTGSLNFNLQKRDWGAIFSGSDAQNFFGNNITANGSGNNWILSPACSIDPRGYLMFAGSSAAEVDATVKMVNITVYYD